MVGMVKEVTQVEKNTGGGNCGEEEYNIFAICKSKDSVSSTYSY